MAWIRLHTKPKICKGKSTDDFNAKEKYHFERSFSRYNNTEDAKYLSGVSKNMTHEIGKFESVRFIESNEI